MTQFVCVVNGEFERETAIRGHKMLRMLLVSNCGGRRIITLMGLIANKRGVDGGQQCSCSATAADLKPFCCPKFVLFRPKSSHN